MWCSKRLKMLSRMLAALGLAVLMLHCVPCVRRAQGLATSARHSAAPQLVDSREYVRLHRLACKRNRTLAAIAEQMQERDNIERLVRHEQVCLREPQAWRWKYFDENEAPKWRPLIRERSIDERLANTIYAATGTKIFNIDAFRFNSGDQSEDALNRRLVAGPEVEDELCELSLRQMLEQLGELSARLNELRSSLVGKLALASEWRGLEERHIRLARVLDSFGRYEANHLSGRFMSFGSPSQCQSSQLLLRVKKGPGVEEDSSSSGQAAGRRTAAERLVNMRFCWARHTLERQLDESLRARPRTEFEIQGTFLLSGVCLPESCHTQSFDKFAHLFEQLISSQFKLPTSVYINETLPLESIFCLVHAASPIARMPAAGRLLLVALACYVFTCLLITWLNSRRCSQRHATLGSQAAALGRERNFCSALDLADSWRDFTGASAAGRPPRRAPVDLDTLNPIKVLGCAYVVFGHSIVVWLGFMMDEVAAMQSYERHAYLLAMLAGTTMVDTFFVISGLLTAYVSLRKLRKLNRCWPRKQSDDGRGYASLIAAQADDSRRSSESTFSNRSARGRARPAEAPAQQQQQQVSSAAAAAAAERCRLAHELAWLPFAKRWLFFALARYMRIVPMFCLVYALKRLVLLHAADGPSWDYGLNKDTPVGACKREPWWTPLTPVSAWYPLTKSCILQSWSLSNDILFSLVSPPIVLLLRSRPRLAMLLVCLLSLLSVALGQRALANVDFNLNFELHQGRGYSFTRIVNEYSFLYTLPTYRIYSLLIGLAAGYLLYKHAQAHEAQAAHSSQLSEQQASLAARRKRDQTSHLAELSDQFQPNQHQAATAGYEPATRPERQIFACQCFARSATCLSLMVIVGMFLLMIRSQDFKHAIGPRHTILLPLWLNYTRVLWALANAFLFLRMTTDWRNSWLMRHFADNFWKVYSKLLFAILLIHFDLLAFVHLSSARTVNSALFNASIEAAGVYLLCLPLSVLLFVLFENPINKLVNLALFQRVK